MSGLLFCIVLLIISTLFTHFNNDAAWFINFYKIACIIFFYFLWATRFHVNKLGIHRSLDTLIKYLNEI